MRKPLHLEKLQILRAELAGEGGGGSGTSGEIFENILVSETQREYVNKGSKVSYSFDLEGNIVQHINFTGVTSSGQIAAKVEILKNTSKLVDSPPQDPVYKNLNIWIGNLGWANPRNIANPTVSFKVEKSWISKNNIDKTTIKLNRHSEGNWNKLHTYLTSEDTDYLYFEAETSEFSPFAITGLKTISQLVPSTIEVSKATTVATANVSTDGAISQSETRLVDFIYIVILFIILLVSTIYFIRIKRRSIIIEDELIQRIDNLIISVKNSKLGNNELRHELIKIYEELG